MDVLTELLAMRQAGTQQLAQIAVLRKANEMQQQLVQMIDEVTAKAPAPPGTGRVVDKQA
jgi:hypothetical protein